METKYRARESSVTNMISNISWQSLEERRVTARLTLMYKIVQGPSVDCSPLHPSCQVVAKTSYFSSAISSTTI